MVSSVNSPSRSSSGGGAGWAGGDKRGHRRIVRHWTETSSLPSPTARGCQGRGLLGARSNALGQLLGPSSLFTHPLATGRLHPKPHRTPWPARAAHTVGKSVCCQVPWPRALRLGVTCPLPYPTDRGGRTHQKEVSALWPSRAWHPATRTLKHSLCAVHCAKLLPHLKTCQQPLGADLCHPVNNNWDPEETKLSQASGRGMEPGRKGHGHIRHEWAPCLLCWSRPSAPTPVLLAPSGHRERCCKHACPHPSPPEP